MKIRSTHLLFILGFFILISSCDDSSMNEKVDYDRTAFLENFADHLIIPAFDDFNSRVEALDAAVVTFSNEPTVSNLEQLQVTLKNAWLGYQYVAYLEVGPSADLFFRDEVNIFPADTALINTKIASQDYVFTGGSNNDVKGFPAIDYLVNGTAENNAEIVAYYSDTQNGSLRLTYLQEVTDELVTIANTINDAWPAYRDTFVNNLGTDIGSSTGIMVNEFNKQFDLRLKNGKIGIPSGVKSLERTNPDKVECFYGAYSKDLALASVRAAKEIFNGNYYGVGTEGTGYDDYLDALGAEVEGVDLSTAINDEIQNSIDKISAIDQSIQVEAESFNAEGDLVLAYNALQAVIPLIKVDMPSAMSVTIAFQDNDGD
ncbi:imelysin family protein [Marivirga atlantica]